MARILVTGSADGIGAAAAKKLVSRGHEVYLHARSAQRAEDAMKTCPKAEKCLVADLSSVFEVKNLAGEIKKIGPFDAIVHNAGVMRGVEGTSAADGNYGLLFATNTLAPYILTSLVAGGSKRYVFLGSQLHAGGNVKSVEHCGYGDSKLHDIMLAFAFSRHLKNQGVGESNALDPGWVPTKMGGSSAPDDINKSVDTYVSLAEGVGATGQYWGPGAQTGRKYQSAAGDVDAQDSLLVQLEKISGVGFPRGNLKELGIMRKSDHIGSKAIEMSEYVLWRCRLLRGSPKCILSGLARDKMDGCDDCDFCHPEKRAVCVVSNVFKRLDSPDFRSIAQV